MRISQEARDLFEEGQGCQFAEPPDYFGAERLYRRVIEIAPAWGEPFHCLAGALQQQGKVEEACTCERRAVQLLPDDPRPLIGLGQILGLLGKYDEAVPLFEKGLALKPHYAEADARLMLAEAHEQLGQVDKAAALWRQVICMKSMYPSFDEPMEEAMRKLAEHRLPVMISAK